MVFVGKLKIRHSGDMDRGLDGAAFYHRFLKRIVARVLVATSLLRGYTFNEIVLVCADEAVQRYEEKQ